MASYTYPNNSNPPVLPPNQNASFQTFSGFPPNQPDNQWNQLNTHGQPSSYSNYDQQNTYNSNQQFNSKSENYGSSSFGYNQQSKKNDMMAKGGNSNFRGNNRNSGQGFNKGSRGNFSGHNEMEEQHDTIFVSGISENTTEQQLIDYFGSIGLIKMDKKTRKPKIWVYKDKETGRPKGEVTITYDDPPTATSAINWFNGKEFNGSILKVELAQRKNSYQPSSGGGNRNNNNFGGNRNNRDFDSNKGNNERGNAQSREGDWKCSSCMNNNFAWRNSCNRCKTEKPNSGGGDSSSNGGERRNNNLPYERRDNGRGSFSGGQRNNGNRNQDRNNAFGGNRNSGSRDQQRGGRNSGGPMRSSDNRRSGPY